MSNDFDPLEQHLRRLDPAPASPSLAENLSAALDAPAAADPAPPTRSAGPRRASLWLSWGIAACMTAAFFARTSGPADTPRPAAAGPRFEPVSTSNILVGALDEGVVFLEDGRPARKMRYEYVDTVNLLSTDATRATLNVSYPREEIRLVPVHAF